MPADKQLLKLEKLFLGLGDKTRLRILNLIRGDEVCVSHFTEVLGESQPKISRHLAYLRRAGIVSARREGTWMHYSVEWPEDPHASKVLEDLIRGLAEEPEMRREHERLRKALGTAAVRPRKEKAPKPEPVMDPNTEAVDSDARAEETRWRDEEPLETFLL